MNRLTTSTILTVVTLATMTAWAGEAERGQVISLNGIEMYYEIHGEGPPLVMLHWFGGSGDIWKPFIDEFSKEYRLIIPDLRGHGRSSILTSEFTHSQAALDVFALLDHLGIDRFRGVVRTHRNVSFYPQLLPLDRAKRWTYFNVGGRPRRLSNAFHQGCVGIPKRRLGKEQRTAMRFNVGP